MSDHDPAVEAVHAAHASRLAHRSALSASYPSAVMGIGVNPLPAMMGGAGGALSVTSPDQFGDTTGEPSGAGGSGSGGAAAGMSGGVGP